MSLSRRKFLQYSAMTSAGLLAPTTTLAANNLQSSLSWLVKRMRSEGAISPSERTAWSVYDFNAQKKLVSINERQSMQAASMIKVFVALAYFALHSQYPNQYPYSWEERKVMERMLVKSSNTATNKVMEWCGGPQRVQQLCQEVSNWQFKQLHIVEYIPKGGKTYRNRASAQDYSRFYYYLWNNSLPQSYELKRILSIPNHDRIRIEQMPDYDITIYNKTGSTGMLCGDGGIVQFGHGQNFCYSFIGIIERTSKARNYGRWIRARSRAMREASELVYYHMSERYYALGYTPSASQNSFSSGGNNGLFTSGSAEIHWN